MAISAESSDSGGGFFGGFASGLKDARENAIATEKQALEQKKQAAVEQNKILADTDQQIAATMGHIGDVFKAAAAQGTDPKTIIKNPAITSLLASAQNLAQRIGRDPNTLAQQVAVMAMRPPLEDADSKKTVVTTAGGFGSPDRIHVFDTKKGTLTPIDPVTGQPATPAPSTQPALSPEETITPRQAQVANPAVVQDERSIPPSAKPVEGIGSRFGELVPPSKSPTPNTNLNPDSISHLSPNAQKLIEGVADGTIDPAKAFSLRKGKDGESERRQVLELVKAYDPSFDMANAPARAATLRAFKSGVEARKISALGTVVGHVNELYKDGIALDNWKSNTFGVGTKAINAARTFIKENEQSPLIRRFDLSANAVSNELETAFRGNTTAISGIQEWRKSINPAMASDEITASTQKLGSLLLARMGELKEQWDRGMGHNQDSSITFKLEATRQLLEKMQAGTLFSDRTVPGGQTDSLKKKYNLD